MQVEVRRLRRLRKLRRVLDLDSRKRLVCAFILTRIDYCNAVLANLPDSALAPHSPLQRVLHAAARFVAAIGPRDHITPTLILLHWLYLSVNESPTNCAP